MENEESQLPFNPNVLILVLVLFEEQYPSRVVANHFKFASSHLSLDLSLWRSWIEKYRFSRLHEFAKPVGSKKIHSGEGFKKDAVPVCGITGFAWTEGLFL